MMNSLPKVIEDLIYDYKLDLEKTDIEIIKKTKNKYKNLIKELEEIIGDGDEYCDSFLRCHYYINGNISNYNYNKLRDEEEFSYFIFQAMHMYNID